MSTVELSSKVHELREYRRMLEDVQAAIDSLTDELKAVMTAEDAIEMSGDDWKISWRQITSSRIDTKALSRELPDIASRYTKTTTSRRFCVC